MGSTHQEQVSMDNGSGSRTYVHKNYALSGKIMLSAIVILFAVVLLIVCLHIYARWLLIRSRRRHNIRRSRHRTHIVFTTSDPVASAYTVSRGLDASVLKALPIFVYSSDTHKEVLECAVCLSEFEENEKGRLLPRCKHSFHIDCIDMWFHSHSTCPLCRAPVQPDIPAPATETPVEVVIPVSEPPETEVESITRLYPGCHHYENETSRTCMSSSSSPLPLPPSAPAESTSLGSRRKPLELAGVSIEVPRRKNEGFRGVDEEVGLGSPTGQGFKSPGSRILSLKRILSRDQRARLSSPAAMMPDCSSTTQIVERFRKILSELGRERKGRDAAENAKSELHTSFNRLKVLANEAIKKRDESERQREEALREKEELLRSNERISGEWRRL